MSSFNIKDNDNISLNEIDPDSFYGSKRFSPSFTSNRSIILSTQHLTKFKKILGPSTTWKIFRKQDELIDFITQNNCDLIPFTFQTENGQRLFLAAHPITFWHYDEQREMKARNSYEIIQEFKPSKLYFDLEFNSSINENCNGYEMVKIFITLVCFALKHKYDITCNIEDVLNLDSSTSSKFSCHLIFQLRNIVFLDNYNMGFFVKRLCHEIKSWVIDETKDETLLLLPILPLPLDDVQQLVINDSKGNRKLFCDESVYSKNRHFRLYKSSKFAKNVPLLLSKINKFEIIDNYLTKEEKIFLSSLITFNEHESSRLLDFPSNDVHYSIKTRCTAEQGNAVSNYKHSSISDIDDCINSIIYPGKIWRTAFFKEHGTIVYDIVGNRYCFNIGRQHKSNNVKYVVDINNLTYYQKCYDPECAGFRSVKKKLPVSENFFLNNNIDDDLIASAEEYCKFPEKVSRKISFSENISDDEIAQVAAQCEISSNEKMCSYETDVTDEKKIMEIADCCELFIQDEKSADFSSEIDEEEIVAVADICESLVDCDFSASFKLNE